MAFHGAPSVNRPSDDDDASTSVIKVTDVAAARQNMGFTRIKLLLSVANMQSCAA
jgi:hypothetical protein